PAHALLQSLHPRSFLGPYPRRVSSRDRTGTGDRGIASDAAKRAQGAGAAGKLDGVCPRRCWVSCSGHAPRADRARRGTVVIAHRDRGEPGATWSNQVTPWTQTTWRRKFVSGAVAITAMGAAAASTINSQAVRRTEGGRSHGIQRARLSHQHGAGRAARSA